MRQDFRQEQRDPDHLISSEHEFLTQASYR